MFVGAGCRFPIGALVGFAVAQQDHDAGVALLNAGGERQADADR